VAEVAAQAAGDRLALAHRALLKTRNIQFDFQSMEPPKPPPWAKDLVRFLEWIAPALKYVLWIGLALGAAFLLWIILRELLPDLPRKKRIVVPATDWRPEPAAARELLGEADALAGERRFEEAIHLLLFRSIEDLSKRRPGRVRPALTSRDIAALDALPADARTAFTRLATAVEMTFFGGRPAGEDAFGAARRDYEAFAFAEGWR
jgi:hypothetical protein